MKGLIVEIKGNQMVVVDQKGNFYQQKLRKSLNVGQEIDFTNNVTLFNSPVIRTMSAIAAVFIIMIGFGSYAYMTPYSYVSLDINPSVEIVLNRFERVLEVKPLNDDAKQIIGKQNKYTYQTLEGAVVQIVNKAHEKDYIPDNGTGEVFITVSSQKQEETDVIEQIVENQAIPRIKEQNIHVNISVENVTIEKHNEAQKQHVSPGKLILLEKLKEVAPTADIEQVKNKSVKDIMQIINDNKYKKNKDKKNEDNKSPQESINAGSNRNTNESNSNNSKYDNEIKKQEENKNIPNTKSNQGNDNKESKSSSYKGEIKNEINNSGDNSNTTVNTNVNNSSDYNTDKKNYDEDKKDDDDKWNNSNNSDKKDEKDMNIEAENSRSNEPKKPDNKEDDRSEEVKDNKSDNESHAEKDDKKSDKSSENDQGKGESTKQKTKGLGKDK